MSIARVPSRAQLGLAAPLVQIEAHLGSGLPGFSIVGLPAPVVRESRERVRSAILNSGYEFPAGRITVNLAPVELSKEGGRYDLPIALALLIASGQLPLTGEPPECFGELGLDGELRPVRGLLLAAVHAARAGHAMVIPLGDLSEVRLVRQHGVVGCADLGGACRHLGGVGTPEPRGAAPAGARGQSSGEVGHIVSPESQSGCLDDVKGQWRAKRALEIAAGGGHSLLKLLSTGAAPA